MSNDKNLPHILLVEDSIDDYDATIRSFEKVNLYNPVTWCKSGSDALDFLRGTGRFANEPRHKKPAIILLDLNMPGLDGRKTLAIIKSDRDLKKIPVIILTTSMDERDVRDCYEMGASTYIQKPVNFENFIEAMRRIKDYWFGVAVLPEKDDE